MPLETFRFLSFGEFQDLPQTEKLAYLARAIEILRLERGPGARFSQIFSEKPGATGAAAHAIERPPLTREEPSTD